MTEAMERYEYLQNTWSYKDYKIKGIVEYVGARGVIATSRTATRMKTPHPGDWVDFRDWLKVQHWWTESYKADGWNTFNAEYGRIWQYGWGEDGESWQICHNAGSAYLGLREDRLGCYITMSGGPFGVFRNDRLEPTGLLKSGTYWNFKDDDARAHNGQRFTIERPVFRLVTSEASED